MVQPDVIIICDMDKIILFIGEGKKTWLNIQESKAFTVALADRAHMAEADFFKNGLPVTTKGSTDYHGYGTRSIRHIAERYGGRAVFSCQDGWFSARILFSAENA